MKPTIWHGCYDGNLKDLIVSGSFVHPAKMARILCERIFDYGKEKGYWKPGDMIIDPLPRPLLAHIVDIRLSA